MVNINAALRYCITSAFAHKSIKQFRLCERGEWVGNIAWIAIYGIGSIAIGLVIMTSLDALNDRGIQHFLNINPQ